MNERSAGYRPKGAVIGIAFNSCLMVMKALFGARLGALSPLVLVLLALALILAVLALVSPIAPFVYPLF